MEKQPLALCSDNENEAEVYFKRDLDLSRDEIRALIGNLQDRAVEIEKAGGGVDAPVTHRFSKGVYAREMFIPKGAFVVGKIHKYQNLNILSKGDLSVLSVDGIMRVKAPFAVVSDPGVKRAVYAHEDCIWTTIHGTDETDVDKIEEIFIAKSYEDVVSEIEAKRSE